MKNYLKKSFEIVNAVLLALLVSLPISLFFCLPVVILMFFVIGAVEIGGVYYYLFSIVAMYVFSVGYIACCLKVVSIIKEWLDKE